MKQRLMLPLLCLLPLMSACNGAMWGNLGVLAVSVGIFMGTLSLGRHAESSTRSQERPKVTLTPRP
jgi:hypothetical protein